MNNVNTVQTEMRKKVFLSIGSPVIFGHHHHRFLYKKTKCRVGAERVQLYMYPYTDTPVPMFILLIKRFLSTYFMVEGIIQEKANVIHVCIHSVLARRLVSTFWCCNNILYIYIYKMMAAMGAKG